MPKQLTWQEEWLRSVKTCEKSLRFFENPRIAAIKTLSKRIAKENVLGHLRKAYHNLELANKLFDMHEGKVESDIKERITLRDETPELYILREAENIEETPFIT